MFVLLQRVCKHVRLGILETSLCVYVICVFEVMYTCKTGNIGINPLYYFCVVVEGMYTCKTGNFRNKPSCLCLCCCRRYVHMYDQVFERHFIVFMFVLFQSVCTHVRLVILATRVCVYVCVVVEGIFTCNTVNFENNPFF